MNPPEASLQDAVDCFQNGQYRRSLDLSIRLLRRGPRNPEVHQIAAAASLRVGRKRSAVWHLNRAASLAPDDPRFHLALAELFLSQGSTGLARESAMRALDLTPSDPHAVTICARACIAARSYRQAIDLLSGGGIAPAGEMHHLLARAWAGEGKQLVTVRRYLDGIEAYRKSLALDEKQPAVLSNLGAALSIAGDRTAAEVCLRRAIDCDPEFLAARSNLLLLLLYGTNLGPEAVAREHRLHGDAWTRPESAPRALAPAIHILKKRLNIGYISSDFRRHPVSKFIEPILAHHDRKRFDVFCYYNAPSGDAITRRLRGMADHWRPVAGLSDEDAARRIRTDRCDILIDLNGHTHGNRLGVMALRAAPIQATYLGYPGTTGLNAIQYRLTDEICDPAHENNGGCTEHLVRIAGCFLCYQPDPQSPPVAPLPSNAAGSFTFGSLNQYSKVTDETIGMWAEVLRQTPTSRLLLGGRSFDDPRVVESTRLRFAAAGIEPSRLELKGFVRPERAHMATYHEIDLALDTTPFNGATTTCEALWMGVPVVTTAGSSAVSRMGASVLNAVGLNEFVTANRNEFVARAVSAASDRETLANLRAGLRDRVAQSPLCDQVGFTRRFEQAIGEFRELRR